jgi:maleate cis-trans isomerase
VFAWRARIGLVKPTHRGKAFAYWYRAAVPGIEIVPTFVGFRKGTRETFAAEAAVTRAEELAADLRDVGCDLVAISGSPPYLLRGAAWEETWERELAARLGIPVVTPMRPHALALQRLGVKRVAIATYYREELNAAILRYFAHYGLEGAVIPGFRQGPETEDLYATPLMALDEVGSEQVYRHCRDGVLALHGSVDALYINGGGWDAAPVIAFLERDLGIPVVWAVAAEMWLAYKTLHVCDRIDELGILLQDPGYRR